MAYRVFFEGSEDRQIFRFRNYDDAFNFASLAVDNGVYLDSHYETSDDPNSYGHRVEDGPRPIRVSIQGEDE